MDTLPVCEESLVKIYKFFHIYTVRVSEHKEFCYFAGVEYQQLLQHSNTKFLLLLPALERVLELFEAEVEASRTHFEVLGLDLEGQVLGLGLEASSPQKLACPRLEDSSIF